MRSSFLSGLARAFDLGGNGSFFRDDAAAIRSDWEAVRRDVVAAEEAVVAAEGAVERAIGDGTITSADFGRLGDAYDAWVKARTG